MKTKELRNTLDSTITFENLEEAKHYYLPQQVEVERDEFLGDDKEYAEYCKQYKEYADEILSAESLEELATVLNHGTDLFGNGSEYKVVEYGKEKFNEMMEETKKLLVQDYSRSSQSDVYYTSEKYPGFTYHTYLVPAGWLFTMSYKNVQLTGQRDLMVNGKAFADRKEYVIKNFVEAAESFLNRDKFYEKVKEKYDDYFIDNRDIEKLSIYSKEALLFNIILEENINEQNVYDELDR